MMRFAICDDEPFMLDELSAHLSGYMEAHGLTPCHIDRFSSGNALLTSSLDYDLIFLDIQMEQPDGMETARRLRQQNVRSLLIFVTVLKECVFDAFEVQAYDYLLKPLDDAHFQRTMDRAVRTLAQKRDKSLLIRTRELSEVVRLSQIVYCEVLGRKVYIHQRDGRVIDYYERSKTLEQRLDQRFFRCHRSYLVNLDYIRGCESGQVLLPHGERIPVSRLREQDLMQALLRRIKERNGSS